MASLLDSLLVAVVLWLVTYLADYYLTLYGQHLWLQNAQPFVKLGGSCELNPYYQRNIDANNRVSRRFIFMLILGISWLLFMYVCVQYLGIPQIFPAAVGFLVLPEIVVIATHVQNIRLFTLAGVPGAIQGEIGYARWVSLDGTTWKYGYWALIYMVFAILTSNWFFAGGVLSCFSTFMRYRRRGSLMRLQTKPVVSPTQ
jgi:hypothetical protein